MADAHGIKLGALADDLLVIRGKRFERPRPSRDRFKWDSHRVVVRRLHLCPPPLNIARSDCLQGVQARGNGVPLAGHVPKELPTADHSLLDRFSGRAMAVASTGMVHAFA